MEKETGDRIVSVEEERRQLKEADDALPQDIKDQYPIESLKEIQERYKHKWVAFLITDVSEGFFPSAGRVVATSVGEEHNRRDLEELVGPLEERLQRYSFKVHTSWLKNHPLAR